ncbi:Cyclic nucleotide-gated cation channel alpha-3 [Hypsibius exemplaris]|uniref:Cyclic nucleotide-gated cation channel alpha-3 n=1 Tax=Hypsibius exemplaris TaxID=2072580 RepID=A0A9X6RKU2_HYPEX|nr:Cyclic nucleotide-gated cation channel alpha-3 [Hypsibius exemplaris]
MTGTGVHVEGPRPAQPTIRKTVPTTTNGHVQNGVRDSTAVKREPLLQKKAVVAFVEPAPKAETTKAKVPLKDPNKARINDARIDEAMRRRVSLEKSRKVPEKKGILGSIWTPMRKLLETLGIMDPVKNDHQSKLRKGSGLDEVDEPKLPVGDPMLIFFGLIRFKAEWVVDVEHSFYYYWLTLVSLFAFYNIIFVALRATFQELDEPDTIYRLMIADYIGDFVFFVDIFVNMFTSHLADDLTVACEPRKLFRYWFRHTTGKMDLLAILPTDLIFLGMGMNKPYCIFRLNRYFKWYKLNEWFRRTEAMVPDPQTLRLISVLFKFFIMIHLNACLYYFVSEQAGLNSDGWVYPGEAKWRKTGVNETNEDDALSTKYTWSFYWSFHSFTMIGIVQQPQKEWQFLFMTAQFVLGVQLFSQILGNTIQTVLKATDAARKFRNKIDAAFQYLEMRGVSKEIQQRVRDYFEYQWIQRRLIDDKEALESLPEKLEADLAIKVHLATLKHVRIFQGVEPGLLVDLVLKLELQVFAPGEYVCRKGDIGRELYIVKKGCLEVVSDDGSFVYARLGEGSVFGEISILNIKGIKSGNRRTANVRSIGYADLFRLSKHHLWEALEEYPDARTKILEIGRQLLVKDNLINLQEEAEHHANHQKFLDSFVKVTEGVNEVQTKFGRLVAERAAVVFKLKQRIRRLEHLTDLEDERDAWLAAGAPKQRPKPKPVVVEPPPPPPTKPGKTVKDMRKKAPVKNARK